MLIYSGDTGPYLIGDTRNGRASSLDVATPWRVWKSRVAAGGLPQRAGYVIDYDPKSKKETNFVSRQSRAAGTWCPRQPALRATQ